MPTANTRRFDEFHSCQLNICESICIKHEFSPNGRTTDTDTTEGEEDIEKKIDGNYIRKYERMRKGFIIFGDIDFLFAFLYD